MTSNFRSSPPFSQWMCINETPFLYLLLDSFFTVVIGRRKTSDNCYSKMQTKYVVERRPNTNFLHQRVYSMLGQHDRTYILHHFISENVSRRIIYSIFERFDKGYHQWIKKNLDGNHHWQLLNFKNLKMSLRHHNWKFKSQTG